jgi:hypothetical protein
VITFHYYGNSTGNVKTKYDPVGEKYALPKTPSIEEMIRDVKQKNFILPSWEDRWARTTFLDDWKRIVREINDKTRTIQIQKNGTEDFVHCANYANIGKRMYFGGELVEDVPTPQSAQQHAHHVDDGIYGV